MYLLSDSKSCQSLDLTPALSPALTGSEMLVWGPLSLPDPLCLVLRIKKVPCRACSACGGDTSEGLALQRPSPVESHGERVGTETRDRFFLLGPGTPSGLILQVKHCSQMGSFPLPWLLEEEGCEHLHGVVSLGSVASSFSSAPREGWMNVGD